MNSGDYRPQRLQILPPVVKCLMIVNAAMLLFSYLGEKYLNFDLTQHLGLYYVASIKFHWYQVFTHIFMHGGIGHLASNMFMLWMFGSMLENTWGGRRFLTFYMVTGLGAAVLHSVVMCFHLHPMIVAANEFAQYPTLDGFMQFVRGHVRGADGLDLNVYQKAWTSYPDTQETARQAISLVQDYVNRQINVPTVGASGAVFGVLLAFGMLFPNMLIYMYFLFPMKAKYFVLLYGGLELFLGISNNPGDNVAHYAHLGGMLFGFLLIKLWDRKKRNDFTY